MAYNYEYPYVDPEKYNDDWLLNKMKELIEAWKKLDKKFDDLMAAFNDLKQYVTNYFDNLDLQEEVDKKLEEMLADGTLQNVINIAVDKRIEQIINDGTLERLLTVPKNVKVYGAKGDGIADDTAAFVSACEGGGWVYVPSGVYKVSQLTLTANIYGDGDTSIIDVGSYVECNLSGLVIQSLAFTGGMDSGTTGCLAIAGENVLVHDCKVYDTGTIGIVVAGNHSKVVNCRLFNIGAKAKQAGIWIRGKHITVDRNRIERVALDGIAFYKCDSCQITNNAVSDCGNQPPYPTALGACGIFCGDDGTLNYIAGNDVKNCKEGGIVFSLQTGSKIIGNTVQLCGLYGINGIVSSCVIQDNVCIGNGADKSVEYPGSGGGITIRYGNNSTIAGNVSRTEGVQTGLIAGSESPLSDSVIASNRFAGAISFPNAPNNVLYQNLNN